MKFAKKCIGLVMFLSLLCCGMLVAAPASAAKSAMIQFSAEKSEVKAGKPFTVTMNISASASIKSVDAYISYDADVMTFVDGGQYVSGKSGLLKVSAKFAGKEKAVSIPLVFSGIESGVGTVSISDTPQVKGAKGTMNVTSSRVSVVVNGTAEAVEGPGVKNDNNSLTSLGVSAGTLKPEFKSDVKKYSLTVDSDVETLYFTYKTANRKAIVSFEGNESLIYGKNNVKVIVTAENGDAREYLIKVKRQSKDDTDKKTEDFVGKSGIGFSVYTQNGSVYMQNDYKFRIVDVEESTEIPVGFKKTSVLLYGVNVTAYTMANDLENDILIMYCMNENGDKEFYQFDRQEKSLQRYTGDLIDRVNAGNFDGAEDMDAQTYNKNLRQMALIVALLAALSVFLIIALINVTLKKFGKNTDDEHGEMDF